MSVLVTGGAGYIGAHVVRTLASRGENVVVADDFSTGLPQRVAGVEVLRGDLASSEMVGLLADFMRVNDVTAVIHLAARKRVPESVARPAWYYAQNVGGLATVLQAMEAASVGTLVFSSSAAVYGQTTSAATAEGAPTEPINPYGATKLIGERLVGEAALAQGLRVVSLRYFNVAGAGSPDLADVFALNLVPMVFERVMKGERPVIFGDGYDTPDGTCVRDFIHVEDLARAHATALDWIGAATTGTHEIFNLGTGRGYSVREVIDSIGLAMGQRLDPVVEPPREGDPASVVADATRMREVTGWAPHCDLDDMTRSAWEGYSQRAPIEDHRPS